MSEHRSKAEVSGPGGTGERFSFGSNWARFLRLLDERRIKAAEQSLLGLFGPGGFQGKHFLDIGSGSGLSSLAARRLGARVRSFDFDPQCVACTEELKRRFFPEDGQWETGHGSVLDPVFLERLGDFDIAYCYGVLHHTGALWQALENVCPLVRPGGLLYLALYNDQGAWSNRWKNIKLLYNRLPSALRPLYALAVMLLRESRYFLSALLRLRPGAYLLQWKEYCGTDRRGMSRWHDWLDWVGGYPFEVSTPGEIFEFYFRKGFTLVRLKTCGGGSGLNEFIFKKDPNRT